MDRTLASLAVLNVNRNIFQSHYIDIFIPFIATLIKRKKYEEIKPIQICEDFKQEFGLIIPFHPIILILNRAKKMGLIKQEENKYLPIFAKIEDYDFSKKAEKYLYDYDKVIDAFIKYSEQKYKTKIAHEEAENTIVSYIKEYDIEILFATQNKSLLPEIKRSIKKRNKYILNKYIQYLHENKLELFKVIENLAIGYFVASPILYENFDNYKGKFNDIGFYLDTNLILKALGSEGDTYKDAYKGLLQAITEQGGRLFVFLHTYEEIMGILKDCLRWLESPSYDPRKASPTLRFFKHNNYSPSDVEIFILKIDEKLQELNIKVVNSPDPNDDRLYQIDEDKLYNIVVETYAQANLSFIEEEKKYVILKDIKSIAAIAKLRGKEAPITIKNSKCIFVTANYSLASATRKFEVQENKTENTIPCCMPDTFIGTLVWLQAPNQFDNLNEKRLVADCYSALQPSEHMINKYIDEIEKLKKEGKLDASQYYVLRTNRFAYEMLQDKVLGDYELVTWKTPLELLKEMEERASRSERKKFEKELKSHDETKKTLAGITNEKHKIDGRIARFSRGVATILYWLLVVVLITPILFEILIQIFPRILVLSNAMKIILIVYSGIITIAGLYSGFILKGFIGNIRTKLENKVTKILKGK